MDKPTHVFDRDFEWSELARFASSDSRGATLGIVSGRRRQGKTFLLDALVQATGGLLFAATEATETVALTRFGADLARYVDEPVPFRFNGWDEALTRLLRVAGDRPTVVVIDEFPFLVSASPGLPSTIQRALGPDAQRANTQVRLLLCGSALGLMGRLLAGNAPLRGRAALELVVQTLDFRLAREFWDIHDLRTAVLVNAVVGGTPAYAREFTQGDVPANAADFDAWVCRAVLNPARPLFREARYLLVEEAAIRDGALYHSVLAAIADGNATRGGIAGYLGRASTDLAHPIRVLEDIGLVSHEPDAFRRNRSAYRIAEPVIGFYHSVMRPAWGDLERPGRAEAVWQRSRRTFQSKVVGPHFERLCREWARWHAASETLGGHPTSVAAGTVHDPAGSTHEVDVAVIGRDDVDRRTVLAIGEAKWGEIMGMTQLRRLTHIRDLLQARGSADATSTRLLCFSGTGFTDALRQHAARTDTVQLIDLDRLYHGA